ncbi:glycerophosphodiester phosphodiesterase family protein [Fluviibacterium sp. S390]|uniref:glycerophosphodiester phosphodiesterase family protein n=1 Tax=Fluviibacterium sp. S390 TaxID=3415139 RepID=UPI003C7E273F
MTPSPFSIIGHRGARGVLPENTLEGFAETLDMGVRALEFDVFLTADEVPVVTHDPRLSPAIARGPDGDWVPDPGPFIRDLTLAQVQSYDVGRLKPGTPYALRFPEQAARDGLHTPTFADLLELMTSTARSGPVLGLIEIKSDPTDAEFSDVAHHCAARICEMLQHHPLRDSMRLQSFDWNVLALAAAIAPDLPRSYLSNTGSDPLSEHPNFYEGSPWLVGAFDPEPWKMIDALGGVAWAPYHTQITAASVAAARRAGLEVYPWTVNTTEDLERVMSFDVTGTITDFPGRALHLQAGEQRRA